MSSTDDVVIVITDVVELGCCSRPPPSIIRNTCTVLPSPPQLLAHCNAAILRMSKVNRLIYQISTGINDWGQITAADSHFRLATSHFYYPLISKSSTTSIITVKKFDKAQLLPIISENRQMLSCSSLFLFKCVKYSLTYTDKQNRHTFNTYRPILSYRQTPLVCPYSAQPELKTLLIFYSDFFKSNFVEDSWSNK